MPQGAEYASFLVRLWRERAIGREWVARAQHAPFEAAQDRWLVQVEYIPTGERQYFSSLEELFVFIRKCVGDQ